MINNSDIDSSFQKDAVATTVAPEAPAPETVEQVKLPAPYMVRTIKIADIGSDPDLQLRVELDIPTVESYTQAIRDGAEFPPIILFHDSGKNSFYLADGFHTLEATKRNGRIEIAAKVFEGTKADALIYAASANATNGLRRTNADKRRAVTVVYQAFPEISSRRIAEICRVSHPFVEIVRTELAAATGNITSQERVGANGSIHPGKKPRKPLQAPPLPPAQPPVVPPAVDAPVDPAPESAPGQAPTDDPTTAETPPQQIDPDENTTPQQPPIVESEVDPDEEDAQPLQVDREEWTGKNGVVFAAWITLPSNEVSLHVVNGGDICEFDGDKFRDVLAKLHKYGQQVCGA